MPHAANSDLGKVPTGRHGHLDGFSAPGPAGTSLNGTMTGVVISRSGLGTTLSNAFEKGPLCAGPKTMPLKSAGRHWAMEWYNRVVDTLT
jgi:hypothetical protein